MSYFQGLVLFAKLLIKSCDQSVQAILQLEYLNIAGQEPHLWQSVRIVSKGIVFNLAWQPVEPTIQGYKSIDRPLT